MIYFGLLIFILIFAAFFRSNSRLWYMNPVILFLLFQSIFILGSLPLLDYELEADQVYSWVLIAFPAFFLIGASIAYTAHRFNPAEILRWQTGSLIVEKSNSRISVIANFIIFFGILLSFIYFQRIGYNLFLDSFRSLVETGSRLDDVSKLRERTANAESSGIYFAAGYVNQFKNVLVPVLSMFYYTNTVLNSRPSSQKQTLFVILLLINVVMLLGTGQRGAFVLACITAIVFINTALIGPNLRKFNIFLLSVFLPVFFVATFFLGRSNVDSISSADGLVAVSGEVIDRFFESNQLTGVIGFRYIYDQPVQYGFEWYKEVIGLLPDSGFEKKDRLAFKIFKIMYGSDFGTSPESISGSIWYNVGPYLGIFVSMFLGYMYALIFIRLIRGKKQIVRISVYSSSVVVLSTWIASGPFTLINTGLAALIVFRLITRVSSRSTNYTRGFTRIPVSTILKNKSKIET